MAIIGDANIESNSIAFGELVQRQLIAQSKLVGTIRDVSSFAESGLEEIKFPKAGGFTVVKKASGTPVTAEALTYTSDILALDQHAVIQWSVEKKALKQSPVSILEDALGRASRAHAKQVDTDIHAELDSTATLLTSDDNDGALSREEIVAMIVALDANEVPEDDRFLAINPQQKGDIMNISDFIDASKFGSDRVVQKGELGEILGVRVISTTVVTAGAPKMYHREAAAIGFQMNPEYAEESDLPNLARLYSLDQLYGVKGLLDSNACVKYDLSA